MARRGMDEADFVGHKGRNDLRGRSASESLPLSRLDQAFGRGAADGGAYE